MSIPELQSNKKKLITHIATIDGVNILNPYGEKRRKINLLGNYGSFDFMRTFNIHLLYPSPIKQ